MFALDRIHYSRNLPIHLRDTCALQKLHPDIYREFLSGKFVGQKTKHVFSSLGLDQMHEQLIGMLKGDGGVIKLTEDPTLLRRNMVTGPELSRIIQEFENRKEFSNFKHHEQYPKFQSTFQNDVLKLKKTFQDLGNPFVEDSGQLISLETSCVIPEQVVSSVKTIKDIGKEQCNIFFAKRTTQETPWTETISQNKLPLFLDKEKPSKQKATIVSLKEERSQIMHLMLSGQSGRDVDEDVFSHENSKFPPSLTRNEEMYTACKSEIVNCIEEDIHFDCQERPASDVVVLDGAFIVQILKPGDSATFEDYANIYLYHISYVG